MVRSIPLSELGAHRGFFAKRTTKMRRITKNSASHDFVEILVRIMIVGLAWLKPKL